MKNLFLKFLGPLLAIAGVLGLTGSSILWNFQGRALGLPATALSLLLLGVGVVLLRPLQPAATAEATETIKSSVSEAEITASSTSTNETQELQTSDSNKLEQGTTETGSVELLPSKQPSLTTAEAIAAELAAAEADKPELVLVNFAPEALRPGNSIRSNKRVPGRNLSGYRDMASELFKSN
ncbi:hypothetical protein MITS9509_01077 [Synechococcus sp. MIT S9509]|uniref:hypothetical protein n=1 Tax=Synechococcus sp. MIT S9509 TaxID=1801630 RepID=UPI0007BB07A2|nr:hypothetical protein [Synechococcus sp. MIT S9509]KZR92628.1 hypothetical protein MITS9509_01077 [Synechococcus sp. MIT S9509]